MDMFEVYCKIIQCFEDIERLCLSKYFILAKKKIGDEGLIGSVSMKCKELRQKAQVLWRDDYIMRKQCKFFLDQTDGCRVDKTLYQINSVLKKERDNKEYLNSLFKEAYYPKMRYSYENDYPEGEPRAEFLLWESGVNPYRDLQNIRKNRRVEDSLGLFEICALFSEIRRVLRKEVSCENMVNEIKEVFAHYHILLD